MTAYLVFDSPYQRWIAEQDAKAVQDRHAAALRAAQAGPTLDQWLSWTYGITPATSPMEFYYRVEVEELVWETQFLTAYDAGDWRILEFYRSRGFMRRTWTQVWFPELFR